MFIAGLTPAALRQQVVTTPFGGALPKDSDGVLYEPFPVSGHLLYVAPSDHSKETLVAGGLFDFGSEQAVRVAEVRALAALGNISAIVADRDDVMSMDLAVGGATPAIDLVAANVEAGDIVTVDIGGTIIETYAVEAVLSTTEMRVSSLVAERSLVAGDSFSIVGRNGTTRYTHALTGTDTLDITVLTTHDVPVGTPAASRLVFLPSVVVLPSQVIKISTVSGHADGWVDLYVVKAAPLV